MRLIASSLQRLLIQLKSFFKTKQTTLGEHFWQEGHIKNNNVIIHHKKGLDFFIKRKF